MNSKRHIRRVLEILLPSASKRYQLKRALHQLGFYDDQELRIHDQVEHIVRQSANWFHSLAEKSDNPRKRILFWTVRGGLLVNLIEALWGYSLIARGAEVHFFICDKVLPACSSRTILNYPGKVVTDHGSARLCDSCFFHARRLLESFRLSFHTFSEFVEADNLRQAREIAEGLTIDECFEYTYCGLALGPIVYSSILRFLLRETLADDYPTLSLCRDYLVAAIVMADISRRVVEQFHPDLIITSHGIYVNWGVITEYAKQRGIPVAVWGRGYRKGTLIISHGTTYHEDMLNEPLELWENRDLSSEEESVLDEYLRSRRTGSQDYISYHPNPEEDPVRVRQMLGLDREKKIVGLFPNLVWDARVVFHHTAFPGIMPWIHETIEYFLKRPDLQLVIRVHPAETKGFWETQQKLGDEIVRWYPNLPHHIKVIPAQSEISTYTLGDLIDAALVYTSKIGLELAVQGVPVIVAGEAFYRGKGFTYDPDTKQQYFALLDNLPTLQRNRPESIERAKRYAYHYFFRRLIPFKAVINPRGFECSISIQHLHDLDPGKDPWLDFINERLLTGKPFVHDGVADAEGAK